MSVRPVCLVVLLLPLGCNLNPKGELPSANDSQTGFEPEPERGGPGDSEPTDLGEPETETPAGDGNDGPDDVIIDEDDEVVAPEAPGAGEAPDGAPADDEVSEGDDVAGDDDVVPLPAEDSGPPDAGPPDVGVPDAEAQPFEALEAGPDAGSDAAP
jgi:hypothetical protein